MKKGFVLGIILFLIISSISSLAVSTENDFEKMISSNNNSINNPKNVTSWPMYQYNEANTGFSPSHLSDSLNLTYTLNCSEIINTTFFSFNPSPLVANGKIFIAGGGWTVDTDVIAINETNGSLLWEADLPLNYRLIPFINVNTPVVSEGKLFVCYGSLFSFPSISKIFALDENTGTIIWEKTFFTNSAYESVTIADGTIIIGGHFTNIIPISRLYAFDMNTGDMVWSNTMCGFIESTPAVSENMVFAVTSSKTPITISFNAPFFSGKSRVYAFDATTGDILWKNQVKGQVILSSPLVSNGNLFIPSTIISLSHWNRRLTSIEILSGEETWHYTIESDGLNSCWPTSISTPAVGYGKIVFNDASGFVIALDEETGEFLWRSEIIEEIQGASSSSIAPSVIADHKVIATSREENSFIRINRICMFNISTGEKIWSTDLGDYFLTLTPFAIANGKLFVHNDENVFIYN